MHEIRRYRLEEIVASRAAQRRLKAHLERQAAVRLMLASGTLLALFALAAVIVAAISPR